MSQSFINLMVRYSELAGYSQLNKQQKVNTIRQFFNDLSQELNSNVIFNITFNNFLYMDTLTQMNRMYTKVINLRNTFQFPKKTNLELLFGTDAKLSTLQNMNRFSHEKNGFLGFSISSSALKQFVTKVLELHSTNHQLFEGRIYNPFEKNTLELNSPQAIKNLNDLSLKALKELEIIRGKKISRVGYQVMSFNTAQKESQIIFLHRDFSSRDEEIILINVKGQGSIAFDKGSQDFIQLPVLSGAFFKNESPESPQDGFHKAPLREEDSLFVRFYVSY